jgi:large subunit ribosomal protein L1
MMRTTLGKIVRGAATALPTVARHEIGVTLGDFFACSAKGFSTKTSDPVPEPVKNATPTADKSTNVVSEKRTNAAKDKASNTASENTANAASEKTLKYKARPRKANPPRPPPRTDNHVRHNKVKGARSQFETPLNIHEAIDAVKSNAWARFVEGVDIAVKLNLDPRKSNQNIKGVAKLPSGTGRAKRVAVIATGDDASKATAAGADLVGSDDLLKAITAGEINFDALIATPEMMGQVGKLGRILGPRGLMPNPKLGTVTKDVTRAVRDSKSGSVTFRVEKKGIIHAGIGRVNMDNEKLLDNIRSFMVSISDAKPEGLKGAYFLGCSISSSQGPGVPVEMATVDPSNAKFMLTPAQIVG